MAVHMDDHRFIGNFGGYGSGKTLTSREEFYKHMILTPGGNTLIGANVQSQYEQTIKRDIENDLPIDFFSDWSTQKQYYNFLNGHRLMFRPFDDADKLRSYNVSMFVILEASEVSAEIFTQLKTRLRNTKAGVPKHNPDGSIMTRQLKNGVEIPVLEADWRRGIIESNPDSGWINDEVLTKSDQIYKHGTVNDTYALLDYERDSAISSHITSTDANEFLPPTFIADNTKNKPAWWVNRYIYGSFLYAEGLVYPSALQHIIPTAAIPPDWPRLCAFDYGLSDDACFLFCAVDLINRKVIVYKEVVTNNRSVQELAHLFYENSKDIPVGGWVCPPIIDPKSGPKRDYEKKTLADHFMEYGISFIPGQVSVDARVFRLNTYLESGCLQIMDCCKYLIGELKDYKFPPKSLDHPNKNTDKPVDKNNHAINPLEWIVMELPVNPTNLVAGIYDRRGHEITDTLLTPTRRSSDPLTADMEESEREEEYARAVFSDDDTQQDESGPFDIDYTF